MKGEGQMKFLKEPQTRMNEEGKQILYLTDEEGQVYHIKKYKIWKNVCIAQEPGGHYSIINVDRTATEFVYKRVQITSKQLIAFRKEEMENRIQVHIYDESGMRLEYIWRNQNGFIYINKTQKAYFIDEKKQKAYSRFHPKYWLNSLC